MQLLIIGMLQVKGSAAALQGMWTGRGRDRILVIYTGKMDWEFSIQHMKCQDIVAICGAYSIARAFTRPPSSMLQTIACERPCVKMDMLEMLTLGGSWGDVPKPMVSKTPTATTGCDADYSWRSLVYLDLILCHES